ncbi:MAG TPA: phosphate ABC transporter ATP-binding protein [Planctomycetota bacterium]|nr:phosphate ABC transporter ATP-binding protein [Planctomycetota bacterium]
MKTILELKGFSAWYDHHLALKEISLEVQDGEILGVIGPAGGGKSTLIRSLNRMNDLDPKFRADGTIRYRGIDLYRDPVDLAVLRRKLGMVFAVPVPLPGSIYQNLAFGPRLNGPGDGLDAQVEKCLRAAFLWEEVKDRLTLSAFSLSGGQQQRLCLARTLMLEPDVLLLDEPCSGLDPLSTAKIEEALQVLKKDVTVVLVTNNVMQASRCADRTAFFLQGRLVECGPTQQIFVNPREKTTRDYVSGRFG